MGDIVLNHPFNSDQNLSLSHASTNYALHTELPLDGLVYTYRCAVGMNNCKINVGDCVKYVHNDEVSVRDKHRYLSMFHHTF